MIRIDNIDELISKFLSGEASPDEAMLLEDWKADNDSNLTYYNNCAKIFELTGRIQDNSVINSNEAWNKTKARITPAIENKANKFNYSLFRIAAAVLLIVGLTGVLFYLFKDNKNQIITYTAGSVSKNITLDDGTDIIISPNSSIIADKDFGKKNRTLHLKGSAYFSVKHNSGPSLLIDAGNVYIKDIGTKFNITTSSNEDTIKLKVDEGIVLLFDSLGTEIIIKASGKALYIKSSKEIKDLSKPAVSHHFIFNDSKLVDIITELNKAYNVRILMKNQNIGNCKLTTNFNNEQIETILLVITETLGLSFEKTQDAFIINGEKCNN
ncbi:MAG: FecR family protein [Bacteroidales bacterium]|nr:FecR family protein [Bacteroidales bacterium]